ncbi:hypothetical protein HAZT_HAZT008519 [Hyalella azteca]|uniref:Reverse transcriptase domain-containing protein n=1 Tax=Hyalella azteca TaxID=294128 RepID=A0A6A0H940_HYAAZ|nr:hypothetical protein HAZT_HAZT008519 [Hyalella azteca]
MNDNPAAPAAGADGNPAPAPVHLCPECGRAFTSARGLGAHRRRAHANEYHAEAALAHRSRGSGNWTDEEKAMLARAEATLIYEGRFRPTSANLQLAGVFPSRTDQAIKARRRTADHKTRVREIVDELNAPHPGPEVAEVPVPDSAALVVAYAAVLDTGGELAPGGGMDWGDALLTEAFAELTTLAGANDPVALKARAVEAAERHAEHVLRSARARPQNRAGGAGRAPPVHTRPAPVAPAGRRQLRRTQYKEVQSLYNRDRRRAAEHVLSGDWSRQVARAAPPGTFAYWRDLFETGSAPDDRDVAPIGDTKWNLANPITVAEVLSGLKSTRQSACGPDRVDLRTLKQAPVASLCKMFNLWLVAEHLPTGYRMSCSTLIPKVNNPEHPRDLRPIAVASHVVRLFHKILAIRMARECPLSERQKAFVPVDGCQMNLAIIDAVIHQARTLKSAVHLAFLDLAKAFDSVSLHTIERAMARMGCPPPIRHVIMSGYQDARTVLSYGGQTLGEARLTRGVKQGDPLSPLLFNFVVDEAIQAGLLCPTGVSVEGERVSILAFADDLVVCCSTPVGLQNTVDTVLGVLRSGGLSANPGKCRALHLEVDRKAKKWYVDTTRALTVGGTPVAAIGPEDTCKYLGVLVGAAGKKASYGNILEDGITQLTHAPLKPQQRLFLLVNHLIPKLMHRIVLGQVYRTQLCRMDQRVRVACRAWLKLPTDVPDAMLHASVGSGGMGVPSLVTRIPLAKQRRLAKCLTASDPVVRAWHRVSLSN